jgi:hypothetical protein
VRDILIWHLKGGIVEPEEMVFLGNGSIKNVSAVMRTHETIKEFWETMFSMWSVPRIYSVVILDNDFNYNKLKLFTD